MDQRQIGSWVPEQDGRERCIPLSPLLAPAIRMFHTAAIQSFCFESKRSGQMVGYQGFDSKQNVDSDDVYQRFDSKQKAAQNHHRSFSQQVMDAQASSWPYCTQRKGEMLMLS